MISRIVTGGERTAIILGVEYGSRRNNIQGS